MRRSTVVVAAAAAVLAILVALNGVVLAQKGKTTSYYAELSATFDDASGMIHSDGAGAYTSNSISPGYPNNIIFKSDGSLYMRIQKNRRLIIDFDSRTPGTPEPIVNGAVTCREFAPAGTDPTYFTAEPPDLVLPGVPPNDLTGVATAGSWSQPDGGVYNTAKFNFALMTQGQSAYVSLSFYFTTSPAEEAFYLMPGLNWWDPSGLHAGIVKVTYLGQNVDTGKRSWEVVPVSGQASLYFPISYVRKVHGSGTCYMGDWEMPFRVTLADR